MSHITKVLKNNLFSKTNCDAQKTTLADNFAKREACYNKINRIKFLISNICKQPKKNERRPWFYEKGDWTC